MIFSNYSVNKMDSNDVHTIMAIKQGNTIFDTLNINYADQILSMTYAMMNDMMGGWMVNLDMILLVEQFEFLGFIILYRKIYNSPKILSMN
ncbi:MAG TPA: hypothetical protein VJ571_04685, partial [Candidatus Nitrosotalea sp.]|nr:hypothetical protein [Candidatus Nitrosotalea sp.]